MEKIERVNYLIDFYEQLLTKKQKSILELYYKENLSLSEIGEQLDISRQAVHDNLSRSTAALERWETKLGLYEAYRERSLEGQRILDLLDSSALAAPAAEAIKDIVHRVMMG